MGQAGFGGEASRLMIFGKFKKSTREKIYRGFTLVFLVAFVLSVVAAAAVMIFQPVTTR